jgi:hypothetical protein
LCRSQLLEKAPDNQLKLEVGRWKGSCRRVKNAQPNWHDEVSKSTDSRVAVAVARGKFGNPRRGKSAVGSWY